VTPSNRRRRTHLALCAIAALLVLCVPALAGAAGRAPTSASAGDLEARAAGKCGTVKTRNGGKAQSVNTVRARCRVGRRVARRANGKRYRAFGFKCKLRRSEGLSGKLYGCGRFKNGRGQGIGFVYTGP
jgi:hypothetical protein